MSVFLHAYTIQILHFYIDICINESLQIYYSTDLVAVHSLSDKKLNYKKEHYIQLLSGYMKNDDEIAALAEMNLRQMDALL